jgi:hypothetical protein
MEFTPTGRSRTADVTSPALRWRRVFGRGVGSGMEFELMLHDHMQQSSIDRSITHAIHNGSQLATE